jgi:transketolase
MALVQKHRPSALLLSRQNLPYLPKVDADVITQGAYVLAEPSEVGFGPNKKPKLVLMATGSEVHLAMQAQGELAKLKIPARVVSVPSTTVFDRQTESYKVQVLPRGVPRVAIEAGVTDGWWKYGVAAVVGLDRFGESAPAPDLFKFFGFTVENVVAVARKVLGK